jgi:hypothetical protein
MAVFIGRLSVVNPASVDKKGLMGDPAGAGKASTASHQPQRLQRRPAVEPHSEVCAATGIGLHAKRRGRVSPPRRFLTAFR